MPNENTEYHVISTTESQVWLIPSEYDGEHRNPDDAEELVREQYAEYKPNSIFYEGVLSKELRNADRDGIALLRD